MPEHATALRIRADVLDSLVAGISVFPSSYHEFSIRVVALGVEFVWIGVVGLIDW